MKIGHGHELVIIARHRTSDVDPLYFTAKRTWTKNPAEARLFPRASDAHKVASAVRAGSEYRCAVEGICTPAFGH